MDANCFVLYYHPGCERYTSVGIWKDRSADSGWKQQIQGKTESVEKTRAGTVYMRSYKERAISV